MAVHDYHEELPGFHPDQILHDGCGECEERGKVAHRAIVALDHDNYQRAWRRAIQWNEAGGGGLHIARAEALLLETLWAVHCQQETAEYLARRGIIPADWS